MENASNGLMKTRLQFLIGTIVIGFGGLGLSIYSLKNHLAVKASGTSGAICNINQMFSCDTVAKSPYSEVFGYPLALWGIGFFAALAVLGVLTRVNKKDDKDHEAGIVGLSYIGALSAIILGLIAWFGVGAICLSCIGIYILNFAQLGLTVAYRRNTLSPLTMKSLFSGLTTSALIVALTVLGYRLALPSQPTKDPSQAGQSESADDSLILGSAVNELGVTKSAFAGLGEDYRKGNDSAKVTVVEFSDFECPACGRVAPVIKELHNTYGEQVLFVFKNFPLDNSCNKGMQQELHKFACSAAKLARCAGQIGKFWDFHDKVFAEQKNLNLESAKTWAKGIGLSDLQIEQCLTSKDITAKIEEDISIGEKAGVSGTPSIYINGRKYNGNMGFADLKSIIDRELR